MARTVLIVDDQALNRMILHKILSDEYEVLEAENGSLALQLIQQQREQLSAVLLDLNMPVMDGYEVLKQISADTLLSQIPVIVTTGNTDSESEMNALTLGAQDFIAKPYNPGIIKRRLSNVIRLRENAVAINTLQRDRLTGLLSREYFFQRAAELIAGQEEGYYALSCLDVDNFKVINDQYGSEAGDRALRYIADTYKQGLHGQGGLCCRVSADNYVMLYPSSLVKSGELQRIRQQASQLDGSIPPVIISEGRYIVDDKSLSTSAMYDRAAMAMETVKGRFDSHVAEYDEKMRLKILKEQAIVDEMDRALENKEFEVWLQPQYNHSSGALIGAEALVRWKHPSKGMIGPNEFIPVFERNGFVYELDKFVWEQTCLLLRQWLNAGETPLPLSVNVSRYDLFREDLLETVIKLVRKYQIPRELLRLEITESAFAKSTNQIISVVRQLIDDGFTVEIDDFGSGYSSLNTLKDVPAQIVKLDMNFLKNDENTDRGGNILESIVRMAKWLGMAVIAEGVETVAQADYLKSIGCNYVQGYLYARPMPVNSYEELTRSLVQENKLLTLETVQNLDNNAFWDPKSMDTLIFNSYVGGACIFEYHQGRIELLRATEKYAQMFGSVALTLETTLKLDWAGHLDEENAAAVKKAVQTSIESRDEVSGEFVFLNLPGCPEKTHLRSTLRVIASAGQRYLVYCTNENITAQREAEQNERRLSEQMQMIMENVSSGITAAVVKDGEVEYIFANDHFYELLGYTKQQYEAEVENIFQLMHPDDRERLQQEVEQVNRIGDNATLEYRIQRRDGQYIWVRVVIASRRFEGVEQPVQFAVSTDITKEKQTELQIQSLDENLRNMVDDMPGGYVRLRVLEDGSFSLDYVNEPFLRLRGQQPGQTPSLDKYDVFSTVHPDDAERVKASLAELQVDGETRQAQYRLRQVDGEYVPVNIFARMSMAQSGEKVINAYFTTLDEQEKQDYTVRETMPFILSAIMKSASDSVFAKDMDLRYICCSPAFLRLTGLEDESQVVGKTDYELFDKETADLFRHTDDQLLENGQPLVDYLEPIPSDDGIQHYSSTSKYILRDTAGAAIGIFGIGRDVTEERTTFEQLQLLINSIPGGIATYTLTPEGLRISYFNDGLCRMLGCTREQYEELTRGDIITAIFDEDRPLLQEQVQRMVADNTPIDCTYRVRNLSGPGHKWVNLRVVVAQQQGENRTAHAVLYDVTEQKAAAEAALIHEQEMQLAMSQLGKMICEYDPLTRVLTVPRSFAELFGMPATIPGVPESIIAAQVVREDTLAAYQAFYEAILRGDEIGSAEYCVVQADGSQHWESSEFSTIFDSNGQPVKTVIAVEDTTEQHLQYELEQNRPSRGEENLLAHALFNLTSGETLDYSYANGKPVPEHDRTALHYADGKLLHLFIDERERDQYRALNDPAALLQRFSLGETELALDYRRRLPDGNISWTRNIMRLLRQPGGSDVLLFDYFYDIDEEKTMQQLYGALVNESYDFVARINGRNRSFSVLTNSLYNDRLIPQKGLDADVVTRNMAAISVHPQDREMMLDNMLVAGIKRNLTNSGHYQFTCRVIHSDGTIHHKRFTQYYLDQVRDIIIMTSEDISQLMQDEIRKNRLLEQALQAASEESRVKEREAAARLQTIMNNISSGMSAATIGANGQINYLFVNDQYFQLHGYTKKQFEEELPDGFFSTVHPEDLHLVHQAVQETTRNGKATVDFRSYRRDGSLIWLRNSSSSCHIDGIDGLVYIVVSNDITREREADDRLRISEEQFRIAAAIIGRSISRYDIKTGVYHHQDSDLLALGYDEAVAGVPQSFVDAGAVAPECVADYLDFYRRIKRGEPSCSLDSRFLAGDGNYSWYHQEATVILDADGQPSQAIIVTNDITEQREKEAVYIKWQQSLRQRAVDTYTLCRCNLSQDASFDLVEGVLLHGGPYNAEQTFDQRSAVYADNIHPEDREHYLALMNSGALLAGYYLGKRSEVLEYRELTEGEDYRWLRLTIELVEYPNSADIEAYMMFEDIDAEKREELRTQELAESDPLTGVLNRTAFAAAVDGLIKAPGGGQLALLMLDLDSFKRINDTFGHATGDQVLIDCAASLRSVLRHGDLLGRLGGDEFLICLRDISDEEAIGKKAAQICQLLQKSLSPEIDISASLGIAICPRDGSDFKTLYRRVDAALYQVKGLGKNSYAFFRDGEMDEFIDPGQGLA